MPERFKVLTYNIQRGLSAIRRRSIVSEIMQVLELSGADIACLQEVWQNQGVSEHQLEALCDGRWHHRLYGKNAVFPDGSQGNAILSRFPVRRWSNVDISVGGVEPRGFLHVEAATAAGRPLAIICCHFGLKAAERRMQALWLHRFIATHIAAEQPVVLAGDFNDWRGRHDSLFSGDAGFEEVSWARHGRFARTFPSFLPCLPLDRIYFRSLTLVETRVVRRSEPAVTLSDHLPVEAVFEM